MELLKFFASNRTEVLALTLEHLLLVVVATSAAALVGIPVGIVLARKPALSRPVIGIASVLQTIPSLALFGFLIPVLGAYGIGRIPAIIALFLYALLPIVRNTYTGISGIDPAVREAARGMGMTGWQMLRLVELPLAADVIVAGLRVATVIGVGTATIAAAIGAGGLGTYIFRGLRTYNNVLILAGAVPAAVLALGADGALGLLQKWFRPGSHGDSPGTRAGTRVTISVAVLAAALALAVWAVGSGPEATRRVTVGCKDFSEQVILGELVAQSLEREGITVDRKFELGGDLCHRSLVEGTVDTYVEYSGTAFTTILKHPPLTDANEVFARVRTEYREQFDLVVLDPLGFNNTFAILVRGKDARELGIRTVSDASSYAPRWRAGFGQDFVSREDGYPGFSRTYGLRFAEPPREMDLSLTYRALASGQVDLIAGNSTDGLIDALDLVQLEDDRHYFPPYEASIIVRNETLESDPAVRRALDRLAGKISDATMRRMNLAVDGDKRTPADVAREFLDGLGR